MDKLKREKEGGSQAGDSGEGAEKVEIEMDALARVKWAFKRGEVRRMQRDLDSMKLTLGDHAAGFRVQENKCREVLCIFLVLIQTWELD